MFKGRVEGRGGQISCSVAHRITYFVLQGQLWTCYSKQLAEMCERFQHLSVALPLLRRSRTFDVRHSREEHQNVRCGACVDPPVPRNQFKTSVSHIGIEVFVHLEDTWFQIRLMKRSMLVL